MLVPAGADSFAEALRLAAETYQALKRLLHERGLSTGVGDEGGFAPDLPSSAAAIELILEAIEAAGHSAKIALALDPAPSGLFSDGVYRLAGEGRQLDSEQMIAMYEEFVDRYPIVSLEDGLAEDEWTAWAELTARLDERVQLVGDDIFVTNVERIRHGIDEHVANAVLIKLNPDRDADRDTPTQSRSPARPATGPSSRIAAARPRTRRSPTSSSPPVSARSRPVHRRAASASPSTTNEQELGESGSFAAWTPYRARHLELART